MKKEFSLLLSLAYIIIAFALMISIIILVSLKVNPVDAEVIIINDSVLKTLI